MVVRPMDSRRAASSTVSSVESSDSVSSRGPVLVSRPVGGRCIWWFPVGRRVPGNACGSVQGAGCVPHGWWWGWVSPRGAPVGLPGGGSGVQGWGVPCAEWSAVWQGLSAP
jgi:hypothetical protein